MQKQELFADLLHIIRTKDDYNDFESQIKFGLVGNLIKYEPTELLNMSGREYKDLFMILTTMLMIDYSDDLDYNCMITANAFYCAYRCIDKGIECNEKLYDDAYSHTNNLLFIYGHKYLVSILSSAKMDLGSVYNPLTMIEISNSETEIYQMEAAQLMNNIRITYSENLYIERLSLIQSILSSQELGDSSSLNCILTKNQELLFKYISNVINRGEHEF